MVCFVTLVSVQQNSRKKSRHSITEEPLIDAPALAELVKDREKKKEELLN